MYRIYLRDDKSKYELNELVKMFLKTDEFQIFEYAEALKIQGLDQQEPPKGEEVFLLPADVTEKNEAKRYLYDWLAERTGKRPDWGTLTGVRPAKLANDYLNKGISGSGLRRLLADMYYLSEDKIDLLTRVCEVQREAIGPVPTRSVGLYIGIPFCPTRCLYCSFTSNQARPEQVAAYLEALHRELSFVGALLKRRGLSLESIYVGGGTPTTLSAEQLFRLLSHVNRDFDMSGVKEFTVEAGRPDTITPDKLAVISAAGAGRISINPQTMKARTLELIGRSHTPDQIVQAFHLAKSAGIPIINADLIAGLPEEDPEDFAKSLDTILGLGPENITIHTLAVKKASRLMEMDAEYHYSQGQVVRKMLQIAGERMRDFGYRPYYMYRQKHMAGNFENVGYALPGTESIYNVRIMEENQTIVALGAGGISKVYFSPENRLERVPNVSNYEIYIERIEEMLERKERGIL